MLCSNGQSGTLVSGSGTEEGQGEWSGTLAKGSGRVKEGGVHDEVRPGLLPASRSTLRRRRLRRTARHWNKPSLVWERFLLVLAVKAPQGVHASWPDGSSTSSWDTHAARTSAPLQEDGGTSLPTEVYTSTVASTGRALASILEPVTSTLNAAGRVVSRWTLGTDCCGLCSVFWALRELGAHFDFAFASDISPSVRKYVAEVCPPALLFGNLLDRDVHSVPPVSLYTASFPCTPFSSAGLRQGLDDPKGSVFFGCASYIDLRRPRAFILENVKGLLTLRGGEAFATIMGTLCSIGGGAYQVFHRVLNSEDSGIPHHRERVFIIGLLRSCHGPPFAFPTVLERRPLSELLDPPNAQIDNVPPTGVMARSNLRQALASLVGSGVDPSKQCYVIDVDATPQFRTVMLERSPCLLKSRALGYFLTIRGRRMTLNEMWRLQGFVPFSISSISKAAVAGMLGNTLTKTVVVRLLLSLLPAAGLLFSGSESLGCDGSSLRGFIASPWSDVNLYDDFKSSLLRSWVHAVVSSSVPFGHFSRAFLSHSFPTIMGRCRDVVPLPTLTEADLGTWSPLVGRSLGLSVVNLVVAGLNFLFLDGVPGPIPRSSSALHRCVFRRIFCLLDEAIAELPDTSSGDGPSGAFFRMTNRSSLDKFPALRAHDVDLLPKSALLDPLPVLPPAAKEVLCNPALLFPAGVKHLSSVRISRERHAGDQVSLVIQALRAGKLGLALHPASSADTFVVGKPDSDKLREVWNGALLTEAAARAPKPPLQACPASLGTLECSDDDPLVVSCRDGRAFFDQLKVPEQIRSYFGRPQVLVAELLSPPLCESGGVAAAGMTLAEVNSFIIDGSCISAISDVRITPINLCFPMGFGWSSYVAQTVMVGSVLRSGFGAHELLSAEQLILPSSSRAIAVATDDVHHFARQHTVVDVEEDKPLDVLDQEWESYGLVGHPGKAVDNQLDARVLGMELRGGKRIQTRGSKLLMLIEAALDLTTIGSASPDEMAVLNGHLQWQNLVNRPMYSCLDAMYPFVHLQPGGRSLPVPEQVLSEVLHNISLFCFWSADLCRAWWNVLPATDASPSYGFGMSLAKCDASSVRALAAAAADPEHYIRLTCEPGDPSELPRAGNAYRSSLTMSDFKDVFSLQAKVVAHSGAMELQAVKLALLRMTRSPRLHRSRGVVLVDAKAICGALTKGRSSAASLKRGVKAISALVLACELRLHYPYLPSESNPADYPSRGRVRKRIAKAKRHSTTQRSSLDNLARSHRQACRRARMCGLMRSGSTSSSSD